MAKLLSSSAFTIKPIPPYSFRLTVRKPAGWPLFTPFEVYERRTLWTATHIQGHLAGIRLTSRGTTQRPRIAATIFLESSPAAGELDAIKKSLTHSLGADSDLTEFYDLAREDDILRHVVEDLHGMHSTGPDTIFPEAALAILLQMAPLKRSDEMMSCFISKYGETAEFDGRGITVWPLPERITRLDPMELATACKLGYRSRHLVNLARKLEEGEAFPAMEDLERLKPDEAKKRLLELPGIGDYSADIINPHGGFPIDAWSVEVFGKLFYGTEPKDRRRAIEGIKREGLRRWGKWAWMAFFYVVQDLENLSRKLNTTLRLE
jgi:3-methyladenine DNA glycosylase/8-oxoguanine DNA glycosylase